jgi:hypothetical protein
VKHVHDGRNDSVWCRGITKARKGPVFVKHESSWKIVHELSGGGMKMCGRSVKQRGKMKTPKKAKKSVTKTEPAAVPDTIAEDLQWNEEIIEDVSAKDESELVVYSRDWTIATIISQIEQKNIDLNPKFQRRNAWDDARRSKLIESLIAGLPVPEIVLAEDPKKKKAFIVIDGKQRLLTIAGFVDPTVGYWNKPQLKKLKLREDLNGKTYDQLEKDAALTDEYRESGRKVC